MSSPYSQGEFGNMTLLVRQSLTVPVVMVFNIAFNDEATVGGEIYNPKTGHGLFVDGFEFIIFFLDNFILPSLRSPLNV